MFKPKTEIEHIGTTDHYRVTKKKPVLSWGEFFGLIVAFIVITLLVGHN